MEKNSLKTASTSQSAAHSIASVSLKPAIAPSRIAESFLFRVTVVALMVVVSGTAIVRQWQPQAYSAAVQPVLPTQPAAATAKDQSHRLYSTAELVYNVAEPANLLTDPQLQQLVDQMVEQIGDRGLPTDAVSISLIDLKSRRSAGYRAEEEQFPASVSKLFWMAAVYAWIEAGKLPPDLGLVDLSSCKTDLCQMIQKSDNEAASRIVDWLTQTQSAQVLVGKAYDDWLHQRQQVNRFFQGAGYQDLNVSQKNFPIADLNLDAPKGADLQMRGDHDHPIRNQLTTAQAARLMQEIVTGQAVSQNASQQMLQLLTRTDLQTGAWRAETYNPIAGFFGEELPSNTLLASKVGWTSDSRQEVAYIRSADGRAEYILVIFASGTAYGNDWKIFSDLSQFVFDRMTVG